MNGGLEMLSCNAAIAEIDDMAAVSAAAAGHSEAGTASACNSEIARPSLNRHSKLAMNDRKWITFPAKTGFEDTPSTMTAQDAESEASTWDGKLVKFTQAAEQRRAQFLWLAERITHDRADAEDVVQEAFFRAFKNLPHFRGESQIATWLGVIVMNTGREWLRNRKGRAYFSLEHARNPDEKPVALELPDPGRDPEQRFVGKEMNEILHSEIERLNSVCKSTIRMCAIEESSHREAANALGVSVAAVKSRVFQGKRLLKRAVCLRTGARVE
jgi:RNA polymerase sigma-70 factor, ECF subfamily